MKHTGDGAMVVFSACSAAVRAAIVVLRRFADHNARRVDEALRVRIGIECGRAGRRGRRPVRHRGPTGSSVCDAAPPERIWVANIVRELCAGKEFRFVDLGSQTFKGIAEPIAVHEVPWRDGDDG